MLKNIALISIIGMCFNLVGCGKAEITSDCTLAGSGDYKCNFKNKGTAEGSACIHLVLSEEGGFSSEEIKETLSNAKKLLFLIGMKKKEEEKKEAYDDINYARMAFGTKELYLSNEICSGLIKANDIREVNGSVSFGVKSFDRRPVDICIGADSWTDVCSFITISPEEVKKKVQETESEIRNERNEQEK